MDPFRFHQYLTEKLRTLKDFLSISGSMRAGLNLPDMGEVTRWMAKREELIGRIDRMDDEIRKIAGKPPLFGAEWPERLREEILLLYKAIEEALQTVKAIDGECQERIAALRNEVKAELQKVFQGMLTVRSYMEKAAHPPRFLDVRR
jgi:hypothetical protein